MFLPSGRVHAIGAGLVIFEIQQNSDTTFRVFDWNRVGLDGKPRELHVRESLAEHRLQRLRAASSFTQPNPSMAGFPCAGSWTIGCSARTSSKLKTAGEMRPSPSRLRVLAAVTDPITVDGGGVSAALHAGQFCLLPAGARRTPPSNLQPARQFLLVEAGVDANFSSRRGV